MGGGGPRANASRQKKTIPLGVGYFTCQPLQKQKKNSLQKKEKKKIFLALEKIPSAGKCEEIAGSNQYKIRINKQKNQKRRTTAEDWPR